MLEVPMRTKRYRGSGTVTRLTGTLAVLSLLISLLSYSSFGGVFTVTNTNDGGPGSLRAAVTNAVAGPGPHQINFNISPCSPFCTIRLLDILPPLSSGSVTIDGYSQPGSAPADGSNQAVLKIQVDGSGMLDVDDCFHVTSAGNVIRGLIINRCHANGISITGGNARNNRVSGNYIGTNYNGYSDSPNTYSGVYIGSEAQGNTVGGENPADRNLISGNRRSGVDISGSGTMNNVVSGNYIGTMASGNVAMPNLDDGVRIRNGAPYNTVGGNTVGQRNLISGNGYAGIRLEGANTSNNTVSGNWIGTNAAGSEPLGNVHYGVLMHDGAHHNTLGGPLAEHRNIIAGTPNIGIAMYGASWNTVSGNFIGTDATGLQARPNGTGLLIQSSNNTIGGITPGEGNVISGNTRDGLSFYVGGDDVQFNVIRGNIIGLGADGATLLPNRSGIVSSGGRFSQNIIGGNHPGERNVISGNQDCGIVIDYGGRNNTVSGNYIGTDAWGSRAAGNGVAGIFLGTGTENNLIGGEVSGSGNILSGNRQGLTIVSEGILAQGNIVRGNHIGTDRLGTRAVGNSEHGILIGSFTRGNYIGPDNLIAYNGLHGVAVNAATATSNFITRNRIFRNGGLGIRLTNHAHGDIPEPTIQSTTFGSIRIAVAACPECAVQVFSSRIYDGEGEFYLGGGQADAAGNYVLAVSALPGPYLTATATDARGTSEFSLPFTSTAFQYYLPLLMR